MINLNNYFDKIYCINLDKRQDRYHLFKSEMAKYGIENVERYSAIDGELLANPTKLLNGELGILQTHINLIEKCLNDGVEKILIMEDDVYFTTTINELDSYMSLVPSNWDFIYFGGNHKYGQPPKKLNDKILKLNFTVALHCVAIHKRVFETILEILKYKNKQVDAYYGDLQKSFNAYGFYPNMAKQMVGYSNIQNCYADYNNFFTD
jgi:GR25 family glycosyltransferase involved in LPS biosynthesis